MNLVADNEVVPITSADLSSVGHHKDLPDSPLKVLQPGRRWVALNLRELWNYRELLYFLTMRDVKVRYKQAALGASWAIIQPLFQMMIFTIFFGRLAGLGDKTGGIPYPIYAYAGLLPWTFFANAVTNSGNSMVSSANLITKVYFPRMIIPAAAVGAALVDFAISFVVLMGLMVWYQVEPTAKIFLLPLLVVVTSLLATGMGMWMSGLNVKYRDIRHALPFCIQIWMFASPIIYPVTIIPKEWRWTMMLNPMAGLIDGYRSAVLNTPIDWIALSVATTLTLLFLVYAAFDFRRMEKSFADVV